MYVFDQPTNKPTEQPTNQTANQLTNQPTYIPIKMQYDFVFQNLVVIGLLKELHVFKLQCFHQRTHKI